MSRQVDRSSDRVTVERFFGEFEVFIAENQKLLDRSQGLMNKIDQLEKEKKQLRDELQASEARLHTIEASIANSIREGNDSLAKARSIISRIMEETDKRISNE